jgi:transposase
MGWAGSGASSVTKQGSKMLRWIMVEAARSAVRHDARMREFYMRVKRRQGDGKAIVAVACKMLKIIWFMLSKREPYLGRNEVRYRDKLKSLEK